MDIQLPDITGMEAARRLKADEQTRAIPIVAVTAFAMSGDRAMILASGCDDYVAKPFNVVEFLSSLSDIPIRVIPPARFRSRVLGVYVAGRF
jgi:two-component system cell cycle response regulator DivK